jgi:hypothetical protein
MTHTTIEKTIETKITVKIISLKDGFAKAFDKDSFLKFHQEAIARSKSKVSLIPLTIADIDEADYAVIATDGHGHKKGQCLLFNANSGASRVALYQDHLESPAENSVVLCALAGLKAIPPILQEVQTSIILADFSICAKTKAENTVAKPLFEAAGFKSVGPSEVIGEAKPSFFYHAQNTANDATIVPIQTTQKNTRQISLVAHP